jgi:aryl-alcohol dehydrogenase-like predicted oxidoreductase
LTGRVTRYEDLAPNDYRRVSPRFQGENFAKNLELVERIGEIAGRKRVTAGQLALAWVLAQGRSIVPIPGTTRRNHLEENIAAPDVKLTESDLSDIESAMPPGAVSGMRYPEAMMRLLNL